MSKFVEPSIIVNRIFYDTDNNKRQNPNLNPNPSPEDEERTYYRVKKRVYLKDIRGIEEYPYNNFDEFTDSPITRVYNGFGGFLAEISFDTLADMLDEYDEKRILKINN